MPRPSKRTFTQVSEMLSQFSGLAPGTCMFAALLTGAAATAPALADITPSDPIIEVIATSGALSGSISVNLAQAAPTTDPNGWIYMSFTTMPIMDAGGGGQIAELNQVSLFMFDEHRVALGFAVTAGANDTEFDIRSTLLSFSDRDQAEGAASSGLTLTDSSGTPDGADLTALFPSGAVWEAHYNGTEAGVDGDVFAALLGDLTTTTTTTEFENVPATAGDYLPIPGSVFNMSTRYWFNLTAGDQASGTSTFVVIPTPAATVVLSLAGLSMIRRRRDR